MRIDTPVLIVGAGATGLTLALSLAEHGVDSLVVDEAGDSDPTRWSWSVALRPAAIRTFDRLGLGGTVRRAGVTLEPPSEPGAWSTPGDPEPEGPDPSIDGRGAWSSVILDELVTLLAGAAESRVEILTGRRVEDIVVFEDHVAARVTRGTTTQIVRASYVVGCDGKASTVAPRAGIALDGVVRRDRIVVHLDAVLDHGSLPPMALHRWDHVTGDVVALPVPGSARWHVAVELGDGELRHRRGWDHAVRRGFVQRTGLYGALDEVVPLGLVPVELRSAERLWRGRVLLAGDAGRRDTRVGAHTVDLGIGDATSLAPKLARVVHGEASDALLHLYDLRRRSVGQWGGDAPDPWSNRSTIREVWPELRRRRRFHLGFLGL